MRHVIVLSSLIALLALACGGGKPEAPSAPTATSASATERPSTPAAQLDARDLLLKAEDVPAGLAQLGDPQPQSAEELFADQPDLTQDKIAGWGVSGGATQVYNATQPYPDQGARFLLVRVILTDATDGAALLYGYTNDSLNRNNAEQYEAQPGRALLEYADVSASPTGDASRMVRYISKDPDETVRLETYQLVFRRGGVVALLWIAAPEGNVTQDQVAGLARKLDQRIQAGLG